MTVARALEAVLGPDLPIAVRAFDGSGLGPDEAPATLLVRSPAVFQRLLTAPGELGLGRSYVTGELDVDGDLYAALRALRERAGRVLLFDARRWAEVARLVGSDVRRNGYRTLPIPLEEARLHGWRHTKVRDAAAIAHHYDLSNAFYRMVLGPSMTYSCAVWGTPDVTLEEAQAAKYELVCRKLGLEPGMRLLDVGCGWGGMAMHAAAHHGVRAVGVTLSRRQAEWAEKAIADAGLADRVEIRYQDYREVRDGPYDAISSIGMFEHVGLSQLACTSAGSSGCSARAAGCSTTASPDRRTPAAHASVARASSTVTSSPTASCTRSATSSRRSSGAASRSATSRASANTTPSRCGRGSGTSRPIGMVRR